MSKDKESAVSDDLAVILDMLSTTLVEIRASDNIETCKALANTFHNVPAKIRTGHSTKNILDEIFSAAERSKIYPYIKKLHEHSKSKFGV